MNAKALTMGIAMLGLGCSAAWAYEGGAVADGGTISGEVKLQGAAPAPKPIEVTKDKEVCAVTAKVDESVIVGAGGGLQDAVVSITTIAKGKAMPTGKAVLDQKGCRYAPHVVLTPVGAALEIKNDDGILHNIHTYSKKNPPINRAQPKFKKVLEEKFAQAEAFEVKCDAHGWMQGWVVVQEHPYYVVTDPTGKFSLTDVPAGEYELKVWHPKLGEKTQKVTVPAKGAATANFELAAK